MDEGYAVYMESLIKNLSGEVVKKVFIERTSRKATCTWEMAFALTRDLERMKVRWQIRNKQNEIVEQSTF